MGSGYGMLAEAIIGIFANLAKTKAVNEQLLANQTADEYNGLIMRNRADESTALSNQKEELVRRQARGKQGSQRAAIGQSGVGYGGSNLDIARQSEANAELDALNVRYSGQLSRADLLTQATLYEKHAQDTADARHLNDEYAWLGIAGSALAGVGSGYGGNGTGYGGGSTSSNSSTSGMGDYPTSNSRSGLAPNTYA